MTSGYVPRDPAGSSLRAYTYTTLATSLTRASVCSRDRDALTLDSLPSRLRIPVSAARSLSDSRRIRDISHGCVQTRDTQTRKNSIHVFFFKDYYSVIKILFFSKLRDVKLSNFLCYSLINGGSCYRRLNNFLGNFLVGFFKIGTSNFLIIFKIRIVLTSGRSISGLFQRSVEKF